MTQAVSINTPNEILQISTIGDVFIDSNTTITFGASYSQPKGVQFNDASIILVGNWSLNIQAATGVSFKDSNCQISGYAPLFADIYLQQGTFSTSNLTFIAGYFDTAPNVFALSTPGYSNLTAISMQNGYAEAFASFLLFSAVPVDTIQMQDMTFYGNGTGGIIVSAAAPVPVRALFLNSTIVVGVDMASNSFLQATPSEIFLVDDTYFEGPLQISGTNSSSSKLAWFNSGALLSDVQFATFNELIFQDVAFLQATISIPSGNKLVIDSFSSEYSVYMINIDGEITMGDLYSFDSDWALNTGAAGSVSLVSATFERNDTFGPGKVEIDSAYTLIYDSDFYQYQGSLRPMLRMSAIRASSNPVLHISAYVDGLEFVFASNLNFSMDGFASITYALIGNGGFLESNGNLMFVSDPDYGYPVIVRDVSVVKSPAQGATSLISVAVWWPYGWAANFTETAPFDPYEHHFEVQMENGDIGDAIDTTKVVGLLTGPGMVGNEFIDYVPTIYDDAYGFGGSVLTSVPREVHYQVSSFTCPNGCNNQGICVGVNTCACSPTFSGYSCGCSNLPADVYCSENEDYFWEISNSIAVASGNEFAFPDKTGAKSSGGVLNRGSFLLKNAFYDFSGPIVNQGSMHINTGVSQVRDASGKCVFVTSARTSSPTLKLGAGSSLTVNLDLSQSSNASCPKPFNGIGNGTRRDAYSEFFESSADFASPIAKRNALLSAASPVSSSQGASSGGQAAKGKATFDVDSSSLTGGKLVINLSGPISKTVELKLINSRNATDGKAISANTATPLAVEVNTAPGVCASVTSRASLVSVIASSCPESPAPGHAPSKAKWIQWGIPVIVVSSIALVAIFLVILVLTVPAVRHFFRPYADSG